MQILISRYKWLAILVVLLIGFAIGKIIFYPPPLMLERVSPLICPEARYFFEVDEPLIALTIDDSPDNNHLFPHTTIGILDVLAQYKAKATFFIITNKAQESSELLQTMVNQGHELGNHLTEDEASIKLGDRFTEEFLIADRFLKQYATIRWFRPGHGWCNASMSQVVRRYNYQIALGSIWSYDTNISSAEFSRWYIQNNIRPGSIIILHDSDAQSDRIGENTIHTLQQIIPQLQRQGYQFVTLSELEQKSQANAH